MFTYSVALTTFPRNFPVMAASSIANIVKSSLGPIGLDKMLIDDIGVSVGCTTQLRFCKLSEYITF